MAYALSLDISSSCSTIKPSQMRQFWKGADLHACLSPSRTSGICSSAAPCFRHVPRHWSGMSWRGPAVRWEDFSSGAEIYRPDRFRRCLGLLLSGRVLVTKGSLTVSTLEPGDLFGAAALYNDSPRLCHHPHRPRDLPLPPAGPGAAGPPSGGGGPAAPELSDLSHRPHPLPQRPAGFPGCGGYGGPGGPLSAQQPLLWRSGVLRLRSGPPAGHQPRLGCIGPFRTWNRPA